MHFFSTLISRTLCGLSCDEAEVFPDVCAAQTKENHLNRYQGRGGSVKPFPHSFLCSINYQILIECLFDARRCVSWTLRSNHNKTGTGHVSCPLQSHSGPWHLLRWVIAHSSVICTYLSHSTMLDFTHVPIFPTDWVDPEARAITCLLCMLSA